jgi:hypothetical protein
VTTVGKREQGYRVAGHRPRGRGAEQAKRGSGWDWGKFTSAVTAFTAIAALLFTALSLQQSRQQNQLAQSGQITDRFNAAVTNLGSSTETIRIGGIFALQRIMQDSPRDQPAVIQVLAALIRQEAPLHAESVPAASATTAQGGTSPAIDVQTALTVRADRSPPTSLARVSTPRSSLARILLGRTSPTRTSKERYSPMQTLTGQTSPVHTWTEQT